MSEEELLGNPKRVGDVLDTITAVLEPFDTDTKMGFLCAKASAFVRRIEDEDEARRLALKFIKHFAAFTGLIVEEML